MSNPMLAKVDGARFRRVTDERGRLGVVDMAPDGFGWDRVVLYPDDAPPEPIRWQVMSGRPDMRSIVLECGNLKRTLMEPVEVGERRKAERARAVRVPR